MTHPGSKRQVGGGDVVGSKSFRRSRVVAVEKLEKVITCESRLNLRLPSYVVGRGKFYGVGEVHNDERTSAVVWVSNGCGKLSSHGIGFWRRDRFPRSAADTI